MSQSEQLQKYLEGEMANEELLAFEAQLKENPELAERVAMHQMLEGTLGNRQEIQVEAELRLIMEEDSNVLEARDVQESAGIEESRPKSNRSRRLWTYISSAAAVALLLVAIRFFFFGAADPNALYAEHFVAYDGSSEVRSEAGVPTNFLDTAFGAYIAGDYLGAAKAFQVILDAFPENARARFYLGICQLENEVPAQAANSFMRVIAHGNNLYISQAHWYLALACLKESKLDCTKTELEILSEKPGGYRERAIEILGKLKL